jgi:branched-chain amino acid transport system permease protein
MDLERTLIGVVNVVFNGAALGMLLFVMSVGLAVTMGIMRFVNLAHGSFAMLGGYVTASLMLSAGWPFLATLPGLFSAAVAGLVVDRLLYWRMFHATELEQFLLTLGLVFVSIALATYLWGPQQQPISLPEYFVGQITIGPLSFNSYRLFIIGFGLAITLAIVFVIDMTRFGYMLRASVDNRRMALGCGINVPLIFSITFAFGCGLAGLGGALSINLVGLDPNFPMKYLIYFLIVVSFGGAGSISGSLIASPALGIQRRRGNIMCLAWRLHHLRGDRRASSMAARLFSRA